MEQIVIQHIDGTTQKLFSKEFSCMPTRAEQNVQLLGVDTVDISLESGKKLGFYIGDKVTIFGRDYTLNIPAKERKISEQHFIYDLQFEGVQYDLLRCQFNVNVDTTGKLVQDLNGTSLTGDLKMFLDVIVANTNRIFSGKWSIGTYPANTETKTLTFSGEDTCLSVLQSLCSEGNYNTEFKIAIDANGNRTIHIGQVGDVFGHTFEYGKGKGLFELTREKVSSSNIVNRLFAYGGTKNIITTKYRADVLCLPAKSKSQSYAEDAESISKYGVWEGTKVFDDVYPHRVGHVTAIGDSVYKFVDSTMDFDLNEKEANGSTKYLLGGQTAKVHFNTGKLAGYEFEVSRYDHASKTFTIIKQTDENDYSFPSETIADFQLKVGDEYVIIDIYQPQSYIDAAEASLNAKANEYLSKYSKPRIQYGLTVDKMFLKTFTNGTGSNVFWVGDLVPIKDADLDVDKSIRVTGFTRNLLDDFDYKLTISDLPVEVSTIVKTITDVKGINEVVRMNNIADPARARRNYKATSEIVTMLDTFKTEALLVGNDPAAQFELNGAAITGNASGDANALTVTQSVLVHNYYPVGNPSQWTLSAFSGAGLDPLKAYRLYAKASKSAATGVYILSENKIGVEDVTGYYHFPVGILSSVIDGVRVFQTVKGYTLITGDSIKTGTFVNKLGQQVLNLDTRTFYGSFVFANGDNVQQKVQEASDKVDNLKVGGRNIFPKSSFENGAHIGLDSNCIIEPAPFDGGTLNAKNGTKVLFLNRYAEDSYWTFNAIPVEPNTAYTMSFWYMSAGSITSHSSYSYTTGENANDIQYVGFPQPIVLTNKMWTFHKFTFTTNSNAKYFYFRYGFHSSSYAWSALDSLKLELGNIPTDWSPAFEDTDAAIAAAQADATIAKAKTEGRTVVTGGVVETQQVLLGTGGVAGMSGVQTDANGKSLPAFWAGGTYVDAIAMLANIVFNHDANAKVGDLYIDKAGTVAIKDETGVSRVIITKGDVTSTASINASIQNDTFTEAGVGYRDEIIDNSNPIVRTKTSDVVISVLNNNSKVNVSGTLTAIVEKYDVRSSYLACGTARVTVSLVGGSYGIVIATLEASITEPPVSGTQVVIQKVLPFNVDVNIPAGSYHIEISQYHVIPAGRGFVESRAGSPITTKVTFDGATRRVEIGRNGFLMIGNGQNYFMRSVENGTYKVIEKTTGAYDIPGILAAGRVRSSGTHTNKYGAKVANDSQTVSRESGRYVVPHNIGHSAYTVQLTSNEPNINVSLFSVSSSTITVLCKDTAGNTVDAQFDYMTIGNN